MTIPFFLPLAPLFLVLVYAFVLFDKLLKIEYQQHRQAWEADGRPSGFFWRAPECNLFTSSFARSRLMLTWLFSTPSWIAASPTLATLLRRQRWAAIIWNVGGLAWFICYSTLVHRTL